MYQMKKVDSRVEEQFELFTWFALKRIQPINHHIWKIDDNQNPMKPTTR